MAMSGGVAVASPDDAEPLMKLLADKGFLAPVTPAPAPAPADAATAPVAPASEFGLIRRVHDRASDMVVSAMNFIGVRYRRGGTSAETGFDCSGFTRHVFEMSVGLVLPRRADEQAAMPGLVKVERDELKPGDLVFFNTMRRTFSHVGIYIGDNRFVHAPSHGKDVRTDDMTFGYWAKRFTGARRAELPASTQAALVGPAEPAAH
jgi:cell wall-associated NlpC family hydrolase